MTLRKMGKELSAMCRRLGMKREGEDTHQLGYLSYVDSGSVLSVDDLILEDYARIAKSSSLLAKRLVVGRHSYSGKIQLGAMNREVEIGSYCSIGNNVSFIVGDSYHYPERVTTFPFGNIAGFDVAEWPTAIEEDTQLPIFMVGNDVWIGQDVIILKSVKRIGNGAILGAGSVVTQDVPDYAIVGGVPAQLIRYRFAPKVIQDLLALRWWEWPDERVRANREFFCKDFSGIDDLSAEIARLK
jgi:acetyltransferase-like isoleucine patch superfamily enzyme